MHPRAAGSDGGREGWAGSMAGAAAAGRCDGAAAAPAWATTCREGGQTGGAADLGHCAGKRQRCRSTAPPAFAAAPTFLKLSCGFSRAALAHPAPPCRAALLLGAQPDRGASAGGRQHIGTALGQPQSDCDDGQGTQEDKQTVQRRVNLRGRRQPALHGCMGWIAISLQALPGTRLPAGFQSSLHVRPATLLHQCRVWEAQGHM